MTVVAIVDDITIMGTLSALVTVEESRNDLQKPANYLVNPQNNTCTMNETHADEIRSTLPNHKVIYVGNEHGLVFKEFHSAAINISFPNCRKT